MEEIEQQRKLLPTSALKRSVVHDLDSEGFHWSDEGGDEIDVEKSKLVKGKGKKPGAGNEEFFDEEAPLRKNPGLRHADETWGDHRSPEMSRIGGKLSQSKIHPTDGKTMSRLGRGNHSVVDENDLE
jgi:hypothetical protein